MRRIIIPLMLIGLMTLASCGRGPDVAESVTELVPEPEPLVELELPLTNENLDVTISSLPEELVASWSDEDGVMLKDRENTTTLVFFTVLPDTTMPEPEEYFEDARQRSARFSGGAQFSTGVVEDAPFGPAMWSASRFTLDGRDREQLELRSPHPSGKRVLELRLLYMQGSAPVSDRIDQLRDLLTRLDATSAG
jgi:hypothetical protein